jgi:hypothetical protein
MCKVGGGGDFFQKSRKVENRYGDLDWQNNFKIIMLNTFSKFWGRNAMRLRLRRHMQGTGVQDTIRLPYIFKHI